MGKKDEKLSLIKNHWNDWADKYGESLRATTKSSNIKQLEIKILIDAISKYFKDSISILEVGCGNGYNAISIASELDHVVDAFDYIPEMIESANSNKSNLESEVQSRLNFYVGDVLDISKDKKFDLVYSCRCLINLPDFDLQKEAIDNILKSVVDNGYVFMIENFRDNHASQNKLRNSVGLESRNVAEFNNFFDNKELVDYLVHVGCEIIETINFSSLHDIAQYVLVPMLHNGEVEYDSEIMISITKLLLSLSIEDINKFGEFGQNKLLVIKK
ncbi:MAG: class I SAM-dependent methyltransferase [Bermanella sp.]